MATPAWAASRSWVIPALSRSWRSPAYRLSARHTSGSGIFDMIFATDHPAGEKIMTDLYTAALRRQPALRRKAQLQRRQEREEADGVHGMFDMAELAPTPAREVTWLRVQHQHV